MRQSKLNPLPEIANMVALMNLYNRRTGYRPGRSRTGSLAALVLGGIGLVVGAPDIGHAADICNAVALVDVPAQGNPMSVLRKGEIDRAVSGYLVDRKSGAGVFCSHGGACYPRFLTTGGRKVEALRLTNCKIGAREPDIPGIDGDDITYRLDVDRSRNSVEALREDDVDNALLKLGLCDACAGNAAYTYARTPRSPCGAAVAAALAGDRRAITRLLEQFEAVCPYPVIRQPSAR
jgi:hypothetical protein